LKANGLISARVRRAKYFSGLGLTTALATLLILTLLVF